MAATNRDLGQLMAEKRFLEDLYYRLNVIQLVVAPLRERAEDIPMLMAYFLHKHATRNGRSIEKVDDDVVSLLQEYHWPGNVRELENAIERAVVLTTGATITREVIILGATAGTSAQQDAIPSLRLHQNVEWMERETIRRALAVSPEKRHAASLMGISPRALSHYLTKHTKLDQTAARGPMPSWPAPRRAQRAETARYLASPICFMKAWLSHINHSSFMTPFSHRPIVTMSSLNGFLVGAIVLPPPTGIG